MTIGPITGAQREKIAILGGGIGALSAAWHLSSEAGWQERYDICVYQHGWRLGGSGAQGSTWYGFYANAFSMLRAAHERLGSAPAGWRGGLRQNASIGSPAHGGAKAWPMVFPVLPGEPGTGSPATMWQMAMSLLGLVGRWLDELALLGGGAVQGSDAGRSYRLLAALARTMPDDSRKHPAHQHLLMAQALDGMRARLRASYGGTSAASDDMQRLRACLETAGTVLKGLFADAAFIKGFDTINGTGLHAWLASHGGDPDLCLGSWPVRAACAPLFGHGGAGPDTEAEAEAGTVLRAVLRMGLGYKGSIAYDLPAGMGDTFAAPLYQVLAGRGVKFRFFHRVEELVPDGEEVATIRITRQAALRDGRYNPLAKDREQGGWPPAPHYAQLDPAQAVLLQEREVDLEAWDSDWPQLYQRQFGQPLPQLELRRGRDFDKVVFGVGAAALPVLCPQLLARSAPLKAAAEQPSAQYRLAADGAGFSNLYLAGDWIKTGLDAPCAESAVIGGMQASRAIGGYPKFIEGETDV